MSLVKVPPFVAVVGAAEAEAAFGDEEGVFLVAPLHLAAVAGVAVVATGSLSNGIRRSRKKILVMRH